MAHENAGSSELLAALDYPYFILIKASRAHVISYRPFQLRNKPEIQFHYSSSPRASRIGSILPMTFYPN
jgi:hypothetical protein